MAGDFPCSTPFHLRSSKQLNQLTMNEEMGCFTYDDGAGEQRCDGIALVTISLRRNNRKIKNIPFLSQKVGDKTYRALCAKCLREFRKDECRHTFQERCFRGSIWVYLDLLRSQVLIVHHVLRQLYFGRNFL